MGKETPQINFTYRPAPDFREDKPPGFVQADNVSFSDEKDNVNNKNGESGQKMFIITDENNKIDIGHVSYDYPGQADSEQLIRVRESGVERPYQGQELGLLMYENLISIAKTKGINGIRSDASVQAGALATWKKLEELGYPIRVHPEVQDKWEHFLKTYGEKKYFGEKIATTDTKDSVFRLYFD